MTLSFGERALQKPLRIGMAGVFALVSLLSMGLMGAPAASAASATAQTAAHIAAPTTDDWPTYLHDTSRSAASNDTTLNAGNVSQVTTKWKFQTGSGIAAGAAIVNGTVYIGSWNGYEYALNAATGAQQWKTFLGQTIAPACNPAINGITSTATVLNGIVYVGGGDSNWYALDATTGAVLWSVPTGDNSVAGGHYNWSSPLIYNGFAYIGVASNCDAPLVQGQLFKVDLTSHLVVATLNLVPPGQVGAGVWTTPSVDPATNTVYVTTGTQNQFQQTLAQAIVAVDANTLAVLSSWQVPPVDANIDSDSGNSPVLMTDKNGAKLVAFANKNGYVYAFPRANVTNYVWRQRLGMGGECPPCGDGTVSSGAFANGTLYMAGGNTVINGQGYPGAVRAFDPTTGAILWAHGTTNPVIPAIAYDNGLVLDGAGPNLEVLDATTGARLFSYQTGAGIYSPIAVAEGTIFFGSLDGTVYALGLPTPLPPPPPPDPNCPQTWLCQDIGKPVTVGKEKAANGTWTVTATGTGFRKQVTADQFRFISQNATGDSQLTAQLVSQQITNGYDQAALMYRQSNAPGSPFYSAYYHLGGGDPDSLLITYRTGFGVQSIEANRITPTYLPIYLEVRRVGDLFETATSQDGVHYTLVPGSITQIVMPTTVMAGLGVDANQNGATSTAVFKSVAIGAPTTPLQTAGFAHACPAGWTCSDVGAPSPTGDQQLANGSWTVNGVGPDIQGYFDQFHFVAQTLTSDGAISAHLVSQQNTDPGAKAGLMMRQSTDPGSPFYAVFATPGAGILVEYRATPGLRMYQIPTTTTGAAPIYLKLTRWTDATTTPATTYYSAFTSTDGVTWTYVPWSSVAISMSNPTLVGMAATSHANRGVSAVNFTGVTITTTATPPPSICPTGWSCGDVGYETPVGAQMVNNGVWSLLAGGNDIWDVYDQFYFVSQPLAADGTVSARVVSQTSLIASDQNGWAKAGVMLRQSSDPGSPYYAAFATPSNGLVIQYRTTQGASTNQVTIPGAMPVYLRVARWQNDFTTYTSTDGVNWTYVSGTSISLNITGQILAGLAATSHNSGTSSADVFDNVSLTTTAPVPPIACPPGGWNCTEVGNPTPAGSQTLTNGSWWVQGGGGDIWDVADSFHSIWQALPGDGVVSAHVVSQSNTDPWAKAGVMIRQSVDPGSPYYAAFITPGHGVDVQYRATAGALTTQLLFTPGQQTPTYLMVARWHGTTFTTYTSTDGVNWTPLQGTTMLLNFTGALEGGLAVTSHNTGLVSTVIFDTVTIGGTPPLPPSVCPDTWSCADIGGATPTGGQLLTNGSWSIQGGGGDIWDVADSFHFAWQTLTGDGSVSAHVVSQSNTDPWAKAGVMIRQSVDPGSPYYGVFVTSGNGVAVQYRATQGGGSSQIVIPGATPVYLRVTSVGGTFTAYTSPDGITWTAIPGTSVTLNITGAALAGLAVTSHNVSAVSTVVMDTVSVSAGTPPGIAHHGPHIGPVGGAPSDTAPCLVGWSCASIGATTGIGAQSVSGPNWTVDGGGAIGGRQDSLYCVSQLVAGNGSVSAQVITETSADRQALAGVMVRQSAQANSAFYAIVVTSTGLTYVLYRPRAGATTIQLVPITGAMPRYLKITRVGATFMAYTSRDGIQWTLVAGSNVTVQMSGSILAGVAVASSSQAPSALNEVTFNHVRVDLRRAA